MPASNFTDSQLSKWANQYEREVLSKQNLVIDRVALGTTAGISEYELPNYITDIRMVLYLGKGIYPKGFRKSVMVGDTPGTTSLNAPYEYLITGKGQRVLKFYPSPDTTIALYNPVTDPANVSKTLFDPAADTAAVLIEFYRTPSITDATLRLPTWLRRWLLKDYICSKAFAVEGPTQHLKGAQYYEQKLVEQDQLFKIIHNNMTMINLNILNDRPKRAMRKPGHPILPPNFGFPANY